MFSSLDFNTYILDFEILHGNQLDTKRRVAGTHQHHVYLLVIYALVRVPKQMVRLWTLDFVPKKYFFRVVGQGEILHKTFILSYLFSRHKMFLMQKYQPVEFL